MLWMDGRTDVHAYTRAHARTRTHTHTHTFNELYFLFQEEEMEGSKKQGKKKTIFISPFMRYKCVIPMVMDQEAKEREKWQKKEEKIEESSTMKIKDEYVNEAEINESKNRVHEHFKQMSQTNKQAEIPSKKKKKSDQLILSQKKKKNNDNDFSILTSYLNAGTVHISKKTNQEIQEVIEEPKVQKEILPQVQGDNNSETIIYKSIR